VIDNFNLKAYLKNNKLLNESVESHTKDESIRVNEEAKDLYSIKVDWDTQPDMDPNTFNNKMKSLTDKYSVSFKPLTRVPGHQEVTFIGTKDKLTHFMKKKYAQDKEDLEWLVSTMRKVRKK
jgi:hypothetical protein